MSGINIGAPIPENLEEKLKKDPVAKPESDIDITEVSAESPVVEVKPEAPKGTLYCVMCLSKTCLWEENKRVVNANDERCPVCESECGCTSPKTELMK